MTEEPKLGLPTEQVDRINRLFDSYIDDFSHYPDGAWGVRLVIEELNRLRDEIVRD